MAAVGTGDQRNFRPAQPVRDIAGKPEGDSPGNPVTPRVSRQPDNGGVFTDPAGESYCQNIEGSISPKAENNLSAMFPSLSLAIIATNELGSRNNALWPEPASKVEAVK